MNEMVKLENKGNFGKGVFILKKIKQYKTNLYISTATSIIIKPSPRQPTSTQIVSFDTVNDSPSSEVDKEIVKHIN